MRETGPHIDGRIARALLLCSVKKFLGFALNKWTQVSHARWRECALHQAEHPRMILAVEKVDAM